MSWISLPLPWGWPGITAALVGTGTAQPGRAQQGEFTASGEGEPAISTSA